MIKDLSNQSSDDRGLTVGGGGSKSITRLSQICKNITTLLGIGLKLYSTRVTVYVSLVFGDNGHNYYRECLRNEDHTHTRLRHVM